MYPVSNRYHNRRGVRNRIPFWPSGTQGGGGPREGAGRLGAGPPRGKIGEMDGREKGFEKEFENGMKKWEGGGGFLETCGNQEIPP